MLPTGGVSMLVWGWGTYAVFIAPLKMRERFFFFLNSVNKGVAMVHSKSVTLLWFHSTINRGWGMFDVCVCVCGCK